ncbi:hypothetical protein I7I51_02904 [Histoplasma capsulatum]|uniref:Uncharacterized protein n=1 Tax=Ajellomyces capsulatus TaxID=5037 RepID=A0A8A1MLJ4_AJECA|nr:hypothetical protein I7I51_02904 [Histoplasma capsulatum]
MSTDSAQIAKDVRATSGRLLPANISGCKAGIRAYWGQSDFSASLHSDAKFAETWNSCPSRNTLLHTPFLQYTPAATPVGCICDSLGILPTVETYLGPKPSEQAPVPFLSYLQGSDLLAKLETNRHGDEYLHTTPWAYILKDTTRKLIRTIALAP